ncbi:MAG: B12-binding domain-containing radical SAM protein [Candidatus Omnitrophica bacterium]|nr:B12-binding domain-containing radical SAM protein [Candidatus Omnitrophota bacterium]
MDRNWINLGLAYIGSCLRDNSYDVDLIDLRGMKNWMHLEDELRKRNPDITGIHFNTVNYDNALQCARIAKQLDKVVVAGGPHASIVPEELSCHRYVDYVVVGEGERAFPRLVRDIERGAADKKVIYGERIEDLNDLPFPYRGLYDIERAIRPVGNFPFLDNGLVIMASRGCPYRCAFCQPAQQKVFGAKFRQRSVENVIAEVKDVVGRYKVKYISFQDDIFTVNKTWVMELCETLLEENIRLQWSAQSRVNTLDEELVATLKKAGCVCLFLGFESGSQRMLDFIRKDITVQDSINAARLCRKHGILIFADYMLGLPGETEEDLIATYNMIRKIRPEISSPSYFVPMPGSGLYDYCREKDMLLMKSYTDFLRNPAGEKIKGIDYALLERYKKRMLREATPWWREESFLKLALKRWAHLWNEGYKVDALREFLYSTPVLNKITEFLSVAIGLATRFLKRAKARDEKAVYS